VGVTFHFHFGHLHRSVAGDGLVDTEGFKCFVKIELFQFVECGGVAFGEQKERDAKLLHWLRETQAQGPCAYGKITAPAGNFITCYADH
jgi:hypothetical protein